MKEWIMKYIDNLSNIDRIYAYFHLLLLKNLILLKHFSIFFKILHLNSVFINTSNDLIHFVYKNNGK